MSKIYYDEACRKVTGFEKMAEHFIQSSYTTLWPWEKCVQHTGKTILWYPQRLPSASQTYKIDVLLYIIIQFQYVKELTANFPEKLITQYIR